MNNAMKTKTKTTKTTTRTFRFDPANFSKTTQAGARLAIDLVYEMREAVEPYDILVQVRPTPKAKGSTKGGAR